MYEVLYFDSAGRAEPIRILLHAAGLEFTDTRFKGPEWMDIKPTTPLGSVPVLKIDDESFCQSLALYRYCAKLTGLYPADPLEALIVDEAMDSISELISKCPQDKDEELKKKNREEFQAGFMTSCAKLMESRIQKYGGGKGFVSSPSVADLLLMITVKGVAAGFFDYVDPKFFEAYPGIMETSAAALQNDKVVSYYASLGEK